MSVDKFGHQLIVNNSPHYQKFEGIRLDYTIDGNYDFGNKRLCHVAEPSDNHDVATLRTVKDHFIGIKEQIDNINSEIEITQVNLLEVKGWVEKDLLEVKETIENAMTRNTLSIRKLEERLYKLESIQ